MRPGRICHDIADRAIPDPFSWAYADPSDRYRTIRTIIDTEPTGMPTPGQLPGCAYDSDGHANTAYRPLLPPVRLP